MEVYMKKTFVVLVMAVSFSLGLTGAAQAGKYDNEYFKCFKIGPCADFQKKALLKRAIDDPEAFESFMGLFKDGGVSLTQFQVMQNQKIIELLTQIKNK